jgi:hypothetical protein
MDDPLGGCHLKLRRALEHLGALDEMANGWLKTHPIVYRPEVDAATGETVFRVLEDVVHPPESWSPIFGEFLYDLRSTLDHLAWQLVIRAGNQPDTRTEFPIFRDRDKFADDGLKKVHGMTEGMVEAIRSVQPCFTPNPDAFPLMWLQDLCNIDKHRELHLLVASSQGGGWYYPQPITTVPYLGPLAKGTELLRVPAENADLGFVPFVFIEVDLPWPVYRKNLSWLLGKVYAEPAAIVQRFKTEFF